MKLFKKILAVVMCAAMLTSFAAVSTSVSADEAKTVVEGARWFPCDADRQNDFIWEVEATKEGCLCQSFDADPADTGMTAFLSTTYGEDGSLTLQRTDACPDSWYWPRIRTISLETYPELDIQTANTLYFDLVATDMMWNITLTFNGMTVAIGRAMAEACGVTANETDAPAGTYQGSINLIDTFNAIAASDSADATMAMSVLNMNKTFVPQVQIYAVGGFEGTVTLNKLYISTPDDPEGAKAEHVDMGMVVGDSYYEGGDTTGGEEPAPEEDDNAEENTATTKKNDDKKDNDQNDDTADKGGNTVLIVGGIIAVVVLAAIVIVVVLKKKKD